jgi:hypothetical protein
MANLSPAAAAVRAAYSRGCYSLMPHQRHQLDGMACPGLVHAILAIADQLVPMEKAPKLMRGPDLERLAQRQHTRAQLIVLARELERELPA